MDKKSPSEIIPQIINALKDGQQTLQQLHKATKINRITLSKYVSAFEKAGIIRVSKEGRDKLVSLKKITDSYFDIPVKKEDRKIMKTIYAKIKKFCSDAYNKEPGKTQVYKIIYDLNKELNLNLPVGWYQHGPCSVLIYNGDEKEYVKLDFNSKIKEKTIEYCKLEPIQLQKEVYKRYNNKLYLFKEKIKDGKDSDAMDLINLVPKETLEVTTDFVRATILLGWEPMRDVFLDSFWRYIATVKFKESLRKYYGNDIEEYLKNNIEENKQQTQDQINQKILEYTDSKHSQEKLYQRWVKQKR